MLDDELQQLKTSASDPPKFQHKVYDVLFLLFELAARHNLDLDHEWDNGRLRKEKYLTPNLVQRDSQPS